MERKEIEKLKRKLKPILSCGRNFFGREAYDTHIKEVLEYFGYNTEDKDIKEIFDI